MLDKLRLPRLFSFRKYERSIWILIIVRSLSMFGFAIYGPYFMLYLNRDRGLTLTLAGVIVAAANIGGAFSQILGGAFTDRFGRRQTMLLYFGINTLINVVLTFMVATSTPVWYFAITYVVSGLVWGMTQPAITAVITDLAPRDNLTEAYGLSALIMNVGWLIGPLLGGYMYSRLDFTYLMAFTIFTSLFSFILILAVLRESFTGSKVRMGLRAAFSFSADRAALTYVFLNLLVFVVYVQIVNTYAAFTVNRLGFTTTQYGLLMTVNAIILVAFQYPVTRLVETRLGDKNALIFGSLLFGAGFLSMTWIHSFALSITAVAVFSAGELLFAPSSISIVGRLAEPTQRGRYMGLLGTSTGLGVALGPLLGGALLDVSGGATLLMWGPISAITFIAALGYLRWFSAYKKRLV